MKRKPPHRPHPYKPPDAAEIETFLDYIAGQMARWPKEARLFLPIWRALERELAKARDAEAMLAAASARFKLSRDRTEARSS